METTQQLKKQYNQQYKEDFSEWRMLGGEAKAQNIIHLTKKLSFDSVLDVGSGDGSVLHWLDQAGFCKKITSVEISTSGLERIEARQLPSLDQVVLFDGYHIPFDDNAFDLATCSHVMEHVEYPRVLLREIKRVSKYQVFEVPIDFSLQVDQKVDHFLSYGHINIYTPQTFRFLLMSEGLKVINYKNFLYDKTVVQRQLASKTLFVKYLHYLKNFLRTHIGVLRELKPDVTTVLTAKTDQALKIM